jgi:ribonuclease HII
LDGNNLPAGLDDSKRMTKAAREKAFDGILAKAKAVALCSMSAEDIDVSDIRRASLEAMRRAVAALYIPVNHVLVDGRDIPPGLTCPATALVKGDQRSLSVAAASIIAKVTRDRMMEQAGSVHAHYGFASHAGYGTKIHSRAIEAHGPVARLHRFTFAPIRKA